VATLTLDPDALLRGNLRGGPQAGDVGHEHLEVGDLALARGSSVDTLGFEVTADLGLGALAVSLPARQRLDALRGRLAAARVAVAGDGRSLPSRDPWRSPLEVDALTA